MIIKFGQQAHLNDSRQRDFKEKKTTLQVTFSKRS